MIHFVYPYDTARIAAPWSIGNHVAAELRARGHEVKQYDWEDEWSIIPGLGDILLGHPHPEPGHVWENSAKASGWDRIVALSPLPVAADARAASARHVAAADHWLLLAGPRWQHLVDEYPRATRLDMAIDPAEFPPLDIPDTRPTRRFITIGCTLPVKNPWLMADLSLRLPYHFSHIGPGRVGGRVVDVGNGQLATPEAREHLAAHDFLIMTSTEDANPTTVLEALCWGLIPICTAGCGWDFPLMLPYDADHAALVLSYIASMDSHWLRAQRAIGRRLALEYSWTRFVDVVEAACLG